MATVIEIHLAAIEEKKNYYRSTVKRAAGKEITTCEFYLTNVHWKCEAYLSEDASHMSSRKKRLIRDYGYYLHKGVFGDGKDIDQELRETDGKGVTFELLLPTKIPDLWRISWEYVRDNTRQPPYALRPKYSIRRVPDGLADRDIQVVPEGFIKVLLIISSPEDVATEYNAAELDVEAERESIEEACQSARSEKRIWLKVLDERCSMERVRDLIKRFDPHIVHITCHGDITESSSCLLLEDNEGRGTLVTDEELWNEIAMGSSLRLLVLSGCFTSRLTGKGAFSSIATEILRKGALRKDKLPTAVLAMQHQISDEDGHRLAERLYKSLADGESLEKAVAEVRKKLGSGEQVSRAAWGVTTLYTCVKTDFPLIDGDKSPADIPEACHSINMLGTVGVWVRPKSAYRELVTAVEQAKCYFILITGDRGNGKTSLVAKLLGRLSEDGVCYLTFLCGSLVTSAADLLYYLVKFLSDNGAPGEIITLLINANGKASNSNKINMAVSEWAKFARKHPFLFVFDGFELLLNPNSDELWDEEIKEWLYAILRQDWSATKFVFTTSHSTSLFDAARHRWRLDEVEVKGLTLDEWLILVDKMSKWIKRPNSGSRKRDVRTAGKTSGKINEPYDSDITYEELLKELHEELKGNPLHLRMLDIYLTEKKIFLKDFFKDGENKKEFKQKKQNYTLQLLIELLSNNQKQLLRVLALVTFADLKTIKELEFSELDVDRLSRFGLVEKVISSNDSGYTGPYFRVRKEG